MRQGLSKAFVLVSAISVVTLSSFGATQLSPEKAGGYFVNPSQILEVDLLKFALVSQWLVNGNQERL